MKFRTFSLGFILGLLSFTAMAGSGHDHGHGHGHSPSLPVTQETATINATRIVGELARRNKLDGSWASVTASSVEKKVFKGRQEWVAVFINDKIADTKKQKLYVFLTLSGDYIAANFTGQ